MSEREEIINLIRNEYDQAPAHYRMGDDWDDGAGRIADAILADKTLALRQAAARIEALEADLKVCAAQLEENTTTMDTALKRIEALEAALEKIAQYYPLDAIGSIARAALDKDAGK